jgi:hypothetical protein
VAPGPVGQSPHAEKPGRPRPHYWFVARGPNVCLLKANLKNSPSFQQSIDHGPIRSSCALGGARRGLRLPRLSTRDRASCSCGISRARTKTKSSGNRWSGASRIRKVGVTPPLVKNCTLRSKADWKRLAPKSSQLAISEASVAPPMIVSGQVDVFPLQRQEMRKQHSVDRFTAYHSPFVAVGVVGAHSAHGVRNSSRSSRSARDELL